MKRFALAALAFVSASTALAADPVVTCNMDYVRHFPSGISGIPSRGEPVTILNGVAVSYNNGFKLDARLEKVCPRGGGGCPGNAYTLLVTIERGSASSQSFAYIGADDSTITRSALSVGLEEAAVNCDVNQK